MGNDPLISYIGQLIRILTQEISALEQIKSFEMKKNDLLVNKKKLVDINPVNASLDKLLKEENALEQRREAILQELSTYFKIEKITLDNLIEKVPPEMQEELIKVRNKLLVLTREIKEYNETNKIILNDILKLVGYALDYYSHERILETNYGKKKEHSKEYRSMVINTVI